jgi:leukotriene-A4 hydrolase
MKHLLYIVSIIILLISCDSLHSSKTGQTTPASTKADAHSYANLSEISTKHLHLELDVNFENRTIYGIARHEMKNNGADTAVFDINGLMIQKVTIGQKGSEEEADMFIDKMDKDSVLGQALMVPIKEDTKFVNIYYQTTERSDALDWLDTNLTSSKTKPFLYTQGQAILTRTWIPLQDSPSNRITYSADVKVPKDLLAVMSAKNPTQKNKDGQYHFEMNKPIPAYLIALAVGDLEYHAFSANSGVYSEPELLPACAYEFDAIPKMISAAEKLYGPYQWGQYDILVLPYSFPFGGMENPMLTFANPTLLAGDKSLVSVIAHELAHSWSGNLVTNRTWNDFWLNEGFTVYFEQRIMESIYGKEVADILALIEFDELKDELIRIKKSDNPEDSKLHLALEGRNPDDGMTDIAYVKGAFFLKTLENEVGRAKFDVFLKKYFETFQFKTVDTEQFVQFLKKNLLSKGHDNFDYQSWIYTEGLPDNCLQLHSTRLDQMEKLADDFTHNKVSFAPKITYKWKKIGKRRKKIKKVEQIKFQDHIVQEWQTFIRRLPRNLSQTKMREIDRYLRFSFSGNSELLTEWFILSANCGYASTNKAQITAFLNKVGRRKYLMPIYEALLLNKASRPMAISIFQQSKDHYHAVSRKSVEALIKETKK